MLRNSAREQPYPTERAALHWPGFGCATAASLALRQGEAFNCRSPVVACFVSSAATGDRRCRGGRANDGVSLERQGEGDDHGWTWRSPDADSRMAGGRGLSTREGRMVEHIHGRRNRSACIGARRGTEDDATSGTVEGAADQVEEAPVGLRPGMHVRGSGPAKADSEGRDCVLTPALHEAHCQRPNPAIAAPPTSPGDIEVPSRGVRALAGRQR